MEDLVAEYAGARPGFRIEVDVAFAGRAADTSAGVHGEYVGVLGPVILIAGLNHDGNAQGPAHSAFEVGLGLLHQGLELGQVRGSRKDPSVPALFLAGRGDTARTALRCSPDSSLR